MKSIDGFVDFLIASIIHRYCSNSRKILLIFLKDELDKAILGRYDADLGRHIGGVMSRVRACHKINGEPLATVTRQFRLDAPPVITERNMHETDHRLDLNTLTGFLY